MASYWAYPKKDLHNWILHRRASKMPGEFLQELLSSGVFRKTKYLRRTRRTRSCNEGICKHHLTHICNQISNILLIYLKGYTRSKMRNPSKTKHVLQGRCVSSSHVIAFAVSTSAHFSWIKKPIQHVYGVGSCYLMAIMQNNLNDMYWLVVSTPLKNISQLG